MFLVTIEGFRRLILEKLNFLTFLVNFRQFLAINSTKCIKDFLKISNQSIKSPLISSHRSTNKPKSQKKDIFLVLQKQLNYSHLDP